MLGIKLCEAGCAFVPLCSRQEHCRWRCGSRHEAASQTQKARVNSTAGTVVGKEEEVQQESGSTEINIDVGRDSSSRKVTEEK
jgi:hypothetical protein